MYRSMISGESAGKERHGDVSTTERNTWTGNHGTYLCPGKVSNPE